MDRQEAERLLSGKLGEYRNLPYPELDGRIGAEDHVTVVGASGAEYQLRSSCSGTTIPGATSGSLARSMAEGCGRFSR